MFGQPRLQLFDNSGERARRAWIEREGDPLRIDASSRRCARRDAALHNRRDARDLHSLVSCSPGNTKPPHAAVFAFSGFYPLLDGEAFLRRVLLAL